MTASLTEDLEHLAFNGGFVMPPDSVSLALIDLVHLLPSISLVMHAELFQLDI